MKEGIEPACTKACPSGALTFGTRGEVTRLAERRLDGWPDRYTGDIYGLDEAGGTSWLYITDTSPSDMYLRDDLQNEPYGNFAWHSLGKTPAVGIGVAVLLAGFYFISGRKARLGENDEDE